MSQPGWEFEILKGDLELNGTIYKDPFSYIDHYDDQMPRFSDKGPLDYNAFHIPTQIALTQLWGKRYNDQQDSFAIGEISTWTNLSDDAKSKALRNTLIQLQKKLMTLAEEEALYSGTTACIVMIESTRVYTVNLGDSLSYCCEISKKGEVRLQQLNKKLFKPSDPSEIARVKKFLKQNDYNPVETKKILNKMQDPIDPRLGPFAMTAALGDSAFDAIGMLHIPDEVEQYKIESTNQIKTFVIVASDGLTESMSNQDIAESIRTLSNPNAQKIAARLAQTAYRSGSTDNITVIAVEAHSRARQSRYIAVFDGHGGNKISRLCAKLFADTFAEEILKTQQ